MILHFLDSSQIGGIETHVETLVRAQRAHGRDAAIILWKAHGGGRTHERYKASGLRILCAHGSFSALCRILRRERPQLLHTHGYKGGILGRLAGRLCGVRCVHSFHAGERGRFPVNAYQFIDEWTSMLGGRIAVSEAIAASLPLKADHVPNFVEVPPLEPHKPQGGIIAFAGRLSEEKGPDLFCDIAAAVGQDAEFVLFGDGPMHASLRLRCGKDVRFAGFASNMGEVWKQTGLLLMPSRKEGLPMAALEAMANGIPVAAAAVGGLPDVIRHGVNGFLFPVGDVAAATQAVRSWLSMTPRDQKIMAAEARLTIVRRFSAQAGVQNVFEVYRRNGWSADASTIKIVQSSSGR